MFFSAQKNKCCSLDFHQDHNIYYRAQITEIVAGDGINGVEKIWL